MFRLGLESEKYSYLIIDYKRKLNKFMISLELVYIYFI